MLSPAIGHVGVNIPRRIVVALARWKIAMFRIRWFALLVALVAVTAAGQLEAKTKLDWNPERTFVFVVGILEREHPEIWESVSRLPGKSARSAVRRTLPRCRRAGGADQLFVRLRR